MESTLLAPGSPFSVVSAACSPGGSWPRPPVGTVLGGAAWAGAGAPLTFLAGSAWLASGLLLLGQAVFIFVSVIW